MKYYTIDNGLLRIANEGHILMRYYSWANPLPVDYEEGKYIVENNRLVPNPDWEEIQAKKEAERIAMLNLTGADVERGIYQAKGMDFDDILAFVMANPPAGLDVKALRIELKANNFYRGNPYVNTVGSLLGFTSEQLDKFFETNDYTVLLPPEPFEPEEPVEDSVTEYDIPEESVEQVEDEGV